MMAALVQTGKPPGGEDYIDEITGLKTQFDVFRFVKRLTEAYRCRAFMVLNLPPVTSFELQSNSVINNWPAELLATLRPGRADDEQPGCCDACAIPRCPLFTRQRRAPIATTAGAQLITALFERFRMTRCIYLPTHDASGLRGAVMSLAGDRELFTPKKSRISAISQSMFSIGSRKSAIWTSA